MPVRPTDYLDYARLVFSSSDRSEIAARTVLNRAYYSAHLSLRRLESLLARPPAMPGASLSTKVGHDELWRMIDAWQPKQHVELRLRDLAAEARAHSRILKALTAKRKIADYDLVSPINRSDAALAVNEAARLAAFADVVWAATA